MANFLFWNTNKRDLTASVVELARVHEVDVLILAESDAIHEATLLQRLNVTPEANFRFHNVVGQTRIRIFSRYPAKAVRKVFDSAGVTIRRLMLPWADDVLLVAVHLPSKRFWEPDEQQDLCCRLREFIVDAEDRLGHRRTILVGDLNMNPFEHGVVSSEGLHAVMSRRVASREKRLVAEVDRFLFYNPMWNHFGDQDDTPPGTHYYEKRGTPLSYFWNLFDQVLVRPSLLEYFRHDSLRILTLVGDLSLVTANGTPDRQHFSDHLPILFTLDI